MLLHQIGQVGKVAAAGGGVDLSPFALKGLAGGRDGGVDILFGGFVDGNDGFLGSRIDGFESLAVDAFDPLVVDESMPRLSVGGAQVARRGSWISLTARLAARTSPSMGFRESVRAT